MHGELVVNCAALSQYICLSSKEQPLRQPSNLLAVLPISVLEAGLHGMSLEFI